MLNVYYVVNNYLVQTHLGLKIKNAITCIMLFFLNFLKAHKTMTAEASKALWI